MPTQTKKIAIIGGGASGLCAAIMAASRGASVVIFEKADRVGKKILKTGNGRCNLTNINVSKEKYNNPLFVEDVLKEYPCEKLLSFFESLGLLTVKDSEGRIYPFSDTATSVLDVLRLACKKYNVSEICNANVIGIKENKDKKYLIEIENEKDYIADSVIVSTGGGAPLLKNLNLNVIPFEPILCPLKTDVSKIKGLSGLRSKCKVTLSRENNNIYSESGEVLFRDFGLSGIVIFNISRFAQKGDIIHLDFLDGKKIDLKSRPNKDLDLLTGIFPKRISEMLLKQPSLPKALTDFEIKVLGKADVSLAQVTRGGIDTKYINSKTFESKVYKNLFVTGEALNIDGMCGGFNLHFAFSSGLIAGKSATE